MNALSWNCRGFGDSRAIQALLEIIQRQRPRLVFLRETKGSVKAMSKIRNLEFNQSFIVSSNGRSDGWCLLWADDLELDVKSSSMNHVNSLCKEVGTE